VFRHVVYVSLHPGTVTWPGWHFKHKPWHDWLVVLLSLIQCILVDNWVHKYTIHLVGPKHGDPYALACGVSVAIGIQMVWSNAKRNH
jgi:hypothetical protein